MEIGIKEKIERWKILAEAYLKEDIGVLIKDIDDNWYFADILFVGDEKITFQCYGPPDRIGLKFTKYWAEIIYFDMDKNRSNVGVEDG